MLINQYAHGLAGKAPPFPLPLRSISRFAVFRSSNAIAHRTTRTNEQPTVPHRTVHRGADAAGEGRGGRLCPPSLALPLSLSLSLSLAPATTIISASGRTIARPPTISISLPNTFDTEANPNTERWGGMVQGPRESFPIYLPPFPRLGRKIRWPDSRRRSRRRRTIDVHQFTLSPRVGHERPRIFPLSQRDDTRPFVPDCVPVRAKKRERGRGNRISSSSRLITIARSKDCKLFKTLGIDNRAGGGGKRGKGPALPHPLAAAEWPVEDVYRPEAIAPGNHYCPSNFFTITMPLVTLPLCRAIYDLEPRGPNEGLFFSFPLSLSFSLLLFLSQNVVLQVFFHSSRGETRK